MHFHDIQNHILLEYLCYLLFTVNVDMLQLVLPLLWTEGSNRKQLLLLGNKSLISS